MEKKRRSCDHDAFPLAAFPRLGCFEVLPRVTSYTYAPSSPVFLPLFNPRTLGLMGNVVLTPLCGSNTMRFCPEGPSSPGRATRRSRWPKTNQDGAFQAGPVSLRFGFSLRFRFRFRRVRKMQLPVAAASRRLTHHHSQPSSR